MPKLEKFRKILIIFLMTTILFFLTGCSKSKEDENYNKKEKVNSEMNYLDGKIITMLNRLNNISFSNYKVVSEDVKEEKSDITNGNEKNKSNQGKMEQGTSSSSSDSEGNSKKSDNQNSESSEKDDEKNKKQKLEEECTSESDSSSNKQSSEDSRRQSNF